VSGSEFLVVLIYRKTKKGNEVLNGNSWISLYKKVHAFRGQRELSPRTSQTSVETVIVEMKHTDNLTTVQMLIFANKTSNEGIVYSCHCNGSNS
jgi:hypothetical protein